MAAVNPKRIYEARLGAGMTQADLAAALRQVVTQKVTERSVRNWERGRHGGGNTPHADVVPAIAQVTGTEIAFLYAEDESSDDDEEAALRRDLSKLPEDLRRRIERALARRVPA